MNMYRYRLIHVIVLGALLLASIVLVLVRGYTDRGGMLIGIAAILFALRLWQFRKLPPPG